MRACPRAFEGKRASWLCAAGPPVRERVRRMGTRRSAPGRSRWVEMMEWAGGRAGERARVRGRDGGTDLSRWVNDDSYLPFEQGVRIHRPAEKQAPNTLQSLQPGVNRNAQHWSINHPFPSPLPKNTPTHARKNAPMHACTHSRMQPHILTCSCAHRHRHTQRHARERTDTYTLTHERTLARHASNEPFG